MNVYMMKMMILRELIFLSNHYLSYHPNFY